MEQPTWYQNAIIYELHIKTFQDSDGDGIGDFKGLLARLDYLQELGVTAIWILPFYPSPLKDDGYDIGDYYAVNASYGTLADFQLLLEEAHKRGLRVITELVLNHTSDANAWFQTSRRAPKGSPERDFYVWSDDPNRYSEARIIFKDFETSNWTWDPVAKAYFWHRFYAHQPDLNFDNPAVHTELLKVIDFWLAMGVDGLRLDAVPYLYEREATNCENLPETHEFLRKLRSHIDSRFPGTMLLAEANQWPEDAAKYFGAGDECQMEFHFPLMPRMFMALQMEDRFPIIDILEQTPTIPDGCQWAIFLRNHDELTLEMVTDEERDYMWRVYALDKRARINLGIRRRLAPLLGNNRKKLELIHSLLFSLPGTPILYYGDEIGMGDNIYLGDRNGVRTPMQWSPDRNAGFSDSNPQRLFLPVVIDPEYHYESVNVENQQRNPSSLLSWVKRLIRVRQSSDVFSRGSLEFLPSKNAKILSFIRKLGDETVLCLASLSRFPQAVELDLAAYEGHIPQEMFGQNAFPEIRFGLTVFTLAPHGFYWLKLEKALSVKLAEEYQPIVLDSLPIWNSALETALQGKVFPSWLPSRRWFGGKSHPIRETKIVHTIRLETLNEPTFILTLDVMFYDGSLETYLIPLSLSKLDGAVATESSVPVLASFDSGFVIYESIYLPSFRTELLRLILQQDQTLPGTARLVGLSTDNQIPEDFSGLASRLLSGEQSNTTILYGDRYFLKFLRQYSSGTHPDLEVTRFLSEETSFSYSAAYLGALQLQTKSETGLAALLVANTTNQGDGWEYALDAVARFYERVLMALKTDDIPSEDGLVGGILPERMMQLGRRTAELHHALASRPDIPEFAPEPFALLWQRSLYQSLRGNANRFLRQLRLSIADFPGGLDWRIERLIANQASFLNVYRPVLDHRILAQKIRIHGDYHLGQVLNTGKEFVVIDFGGEPRKSLGERAIKRNPLVDVAGMLRSFDYASQIALRNEDVANRSLLEAWAQIWVTKMSDSFLAGYLEIAGNGDLIPKDRSEFDLLLKVFLLDKAIYEVGYETSYRPDYADIPLRAVESLLGLTLDQGSEERPIQERKNLPKV